MKRFLPLISFLFFSLVSQSVPVRPGTQKNIVLADGTVVTARLVGDEYSHYWQTADGRKWHLQADDTPLLLPETEATLLKEQAHAKRAKRNTARQKRIAARAIGNTGEMIGSKKGLIILVNFTDLEMKEDHTQEVFNDMFNLEGYCENGHIGSLHDYFYDQSYGLFDLTFDVVGPVTVSQKYSYYGRNRSDGNDAHPGEMVIEACTLADEYVDFTDYDWDGDGEVDQVFVVYAGHGEASGASSNTIWPHEWDLSSCQYYGDGNGAQVFDGVTVNTYAVSCELLGRNGSQLDGIGTACHEFSHCLGYPDFYDTDYSGAFGMDAWDVMDTGCYNGPGANGSVPSGYTSYERWVAGWLTPTELTIGMEVTDLKFLGDYPEAYIVYNDANHNEYYLLENRKPSRWFSYLYNLHEVADGLLAIHVDYSAAAWEANTPNDNKNHQRMTIIPANNSFSTSSSSAYAGMVYPYRNNDSITNNSKPAATVFNKNTDGKKFMNKPIMNIRLNADGTISFDCPAPPAEPDPEIPEGYVFYETFDKCSGTGGNDGRWSGIVATATFAPDYPSGWEGGKIYGANKCARAGSTILSGEITTPEFTLQGLGTLTFRAAPWLAPGEGADLTVSIDGQPIGEGTYTLAEGEWTDFSIPIEGDGPMRITFSPSKRFFIDEVHVAIGQPDGIADIPAQQPASSAIYTISGQRLTHTVRGINIVGGKKIVVR